MSAANLRSSKRRRRRPPYYHASTAAEERHLQHAIQNSKLDRGRPADGRLNVPLAPTFFPTVEDFEGNPISYIEKIRPVAERFGVCKIVPPKGWNPAPFGTWDRMRTLSGLWRIVRSNSIRRVVVWLLLRPSQLRWESPAPCTNIVVRSSIGTLEFVCASGCGS
jgi:jmjN domain